MTRFMPTRFTHLFVTQARLKIGLFISSLTIVLNHYSVIPAKAGTRRTQGGARKKPGPGLRRDDGLCGKTGVLLLQEHDQKNVCIL